MTNKIIGKYIIMILDELRKMDSFQNYINSNYNKKGFSVWDDRLWEFMKESICDIEGFKFGINKHICTYYDGITEYQYTDIKSTDIVLDIGANIGIFSILASKKASHVYAIEPLFTDIIRKNIELNNIKNITVIEAGLGKGKTNIEYWERNKKDVDCYSLNTLIEMCGGHIDFLKTDCEGGEWFIEEDELKGIRRFEGEIHPTNNHNPKHFLSKLNKFRLTYNPSESCPSNLIVHATRND